MNIIFSKVGSVTRLRSMIKCKPLIRGAILMDQDWMPGPYPKNEEERRAAAKKYNLLPEEYEPLDPKWDCGMGDYPVLPNIHNEHKDPYGDYAYLADRRDFGEPVHHNYEIYQSCMPTISLENERYYQTVSIAVLGTWFMFLTIYMYQYYMKHFPFITKMKPAHMPVDGDHYHYPTSDLSKY